MGQQLEPGPQTEEHRGPTSEELISAALLEHLEEQGIDPHAPASLPPASTSRGPAIPTWFQKASDNI